MRNGFIFNHARCVNCKACSAACILENGWTVSPRNIYIYNAEADTILPVINLSLACNHCETAVCMTGCPASVFSRDTITGAVIFDEKKCIGCKYCQWNCPYDAPKFDSEKRTVAKCNLCNSGLAEGRLPACSAACPTGALTFGQLPEPVPETIYPWFPDKKLMPAISFTNNKQVIPLKIIPENNSPVYDYRQSNKSRNISGELSLLFFSFFSMLSVALVMSSFLNETFPDKWLFMFLLATSGIISFFHLGKKFRSWRSVSNLRHSPLSREIGSFILYAGVSVIAVIFQLPFLLVGAAITGLIFLLIIDSVYIFSDRNKATFLHSGQTFISALLIVSFFSATIVPFIFISLIKIGLTLYNLTDKRNGNSYFVVRFIRMVFLIVPGLSIVLQHSHPDIIINIIFLTGELTDRILFYFDFDPLNISRLITEQVNSDIHEKKNDK